MPPIEHSLTPCECHGPTRRDLLKTSAKLAIASSLASNFVAVVKAREAKEIDRSTFAQINSMLSAAVRAGDVPGVVALAAAMTRATIFRIASMVKLITSVAAMQLVEQQRLSLDDPVPDIDPALGSPQVLQGFDAAGQLLLRPAKRPITLRQLLTHTAGFTYRLWDAKAVQYFKAINGCLLPPEPKRRTHH